MQFIFNAIIYVLLCIIYLILKNTLQQYIKKYKIIYVLYSSACMQTIYIHTYMHTSAPSAAIYIRNSKLFGEVGPN